jgi:peroxiredoxin
MNAMKMMSAVAATTVAALTIALAPAAQADHHKMGSKTAKVGEKAPDFTLTDLQGDKHTLSDYTDEGKFVVLEWFNPDCPFVVKHHERHKTMYDLARMVEDNGGVWLAINSGKPGKQGTGHDRNMKAMKDFGIEYPILLDETSKVGEMYDAKVTPHMYIIDEEGTLVYAGAIDNNRSARTLGDTNYVKKALKEHMAGKAVSITETKPYGCSVKY